MKNYLVKKTQTFYTTVQAKSKLEAIEKSQSEGSTDDYLVIDKNNKIHKAISNTKKSAFEIHIKFKLTGEE